MQRIDSKKKLINDEDIPIDVLLLGESLIHDFRQDSSLGDDDFTELESEESEVETDEDQTESSDTVAQQNAQVKRSLEMV